MTELARRHPTPFALAGALVAAILWYALASATGLIFHLMPAGPTLAAAWILRWSDERPSTTSRFAAIGAGAFVALAMTAILAGAGMPLDDPLITGLAIVSGVALSGWLLRAPHVRAVS